MKPATIAPPGSRSRSFGDTAFLVNRICFCLAALLSALFLGAGCSASGRQAAPPSGAVGSPATSAPVIAEGALVPVAQAARTADGEGPVPIHPDDARLGPDGAEVTIVYATDLQCPFCGRADVTLNQLRQKYGPRLRLVMKHLPLEFHPMAAPAALAAMKVQREEGDAAFFRFVSVVLANQSSLTLENLSAWSARLRGTGSRRAFSSSPDDQLRRDMDWASQHGMFGTPNFLVNGRRIAGAQPFENFAQVIDQELAELAAARAEGKPVHYAARTAANYQAPEPRPALAVEDDGRIYNVPVGNSPVWGKADALVTIVEFSDYECPFCKRGQRTMEALMQKYGADLRIVFKHHPLPFHERADEAAALALEAYRQRGNDAFWQATRSLFEAPREAFSDAGLEGLGKALKLNPEKVRTALKRGADDPGIQADMAMAEALSAPGTPAFFINGHKLVGAQPLAVFEEAVEEQLAAARAMVKAGAPRTEVYERIMGIAGGR